MACNRFARPRNVIRGAMLAAISLSFVGVATAQNLDCFNRELKLPAAPTEAQANRCSDAINDSSLRADRQGIALYNAVRLNAVRADTTTDPVAKAALYNRIVQDVSRSRDRAPDTSTTFTEKWDGWRNKDEQLAVNRRIVADRRFQLAKAYVGLGKFGGSGAACSSADDCNQRAITELTALIDNKVGGDIFSESVYLRASAYVDTRRIALARPDLEALRNIPRYQAWAKSSLGAFYREEAKKRLEPPLTLVKVSDARNELNNALGIDSSLLDVRLDYARTYLQEVALLTAGGDKKAALTAAQREYGTAIQAAAGGSTVQRVDAYAGRGDAYYQEALLETDPNVRHTRLASAIADLGEAAKLDATATGADIQWKYARALAADNRTAEATAAFAEAARRYGGIGNGRLAQAEVDFMEGRKSFEDKQFGAARTKFVSVTSVGQGEKTAPAYYYLSAIDLIDKVSPVSNAEQAASAGGGGSPYREQACLARIFQGDAPVINKSALSACTGSDVLVGMFYLRNAQLVPASQRAAARKQAQDAFDRARGSTATLQKWPGSPAYSIADVATVGYALAAWCSTDGSTGIQVGLPADRLNTAADFLTTYRVYACR